MAEAERQATERDCPQLYRGSWKNLSNELHPAGKRETEKGQKVKR
jgi:hypothetical protein